MRFRLFLGTCVAWLFVALMAIGYFGFVLLAVLQAAGVKTGAAPFNFFSGISMLQWVLNTPLALILLGLGLIGTLGLAFTAPPMKKWLTCFAPLAHSCAFGYHSRAMLSRAQEARVRAILWSSAAGTVQSYCLEHLATAAKIAPGHLSDLAIFVRALHERGDCQRRFGGFCDADQHVTKQTLVWGPPARLMANGPSGP